MGTRAAGRGSRLGSPHPLAYLYDRRSRSLWRHARGGSPLGVPGPRSRKHRSPPAPKGGCLLGAGSPCTVSPFLPRPGGSRKRWAGRLPKRCLPTGSVCPRGRTSLTRSWRGWCSGVGRVSGVEGRVVPEGRLSLGADHHDATPKFKRPSGTSALEILIVQIFIQRRCLQLAQVSHVAVELLQAHCDDRGIHALSLPVECAAWQHPGDNEKMVWRRCCL
jgi:hypothetical protein